MVALWRAEGSLQVGLDDPALILQGVPPELKMAIGLLARPQTATALNLLLPQVDSAWIDWLILRLREADLLVVAPTKAAPTIGVTGSGELAESIRSALRSANVPNRVVEADAFAGDFPTPDLVVLATAFAEPDRALTDSLLLSGRAHLVVRAEPGRAIVGPLVAPGLTACLRCADLGNCRLDPDWPLLLAQLCRESTELDPTLLAWASAMTAAQVRGWLHGGGVQTAGATLELGLPDFELVTRSWAAHPACACLTPLEAA